MRETKKNKQEVENWIKKNGACQIDIKEENIKLCNGGLFEDMNKQFATLWIGELNDTIRYLRRLKFFLNKQKFNTQRSMEDFLRQKKT